jgi:hypothetical protein
MKNLFSITRKEVLFLLKFVAGQCFFLYLSLLAYRWAKLFGYHDGGLFTFGILVGLDLWVIVLSAFRMSKL